MRDALDSGGSYVPKDLLKTTDPAVVAANTAADKNVFTFVAPNLKVNSQYAFQFKYVFEDGTESDQWSPTYMVFTSNVATLPKPKLTSANVTYFQGILKVTWDGTDYNNTAYGNGFSRILIWVRDNSTPGQLFKIVGELSKPGTWSLAVPPKSQTVKLTAISVNGEESAYSDEFTITPVVAAPIGVTGVTPAWSGTNFTLTFTHDPSNSANEYLKEYLITLNTATSGTKVFSLLPVSGTTQKFALSLAQNQAAFGTAEKSFSGTIETLDIYGNKGTAIPFTNTAYVSALSTPTLTVSAITNGYSVTYPTQTSNTFQFISVEEVVSNSATDPGTGYTGVATGTGNPLVVPTVNTNKRWVRAKLYDTVNESTGYSTAVAVTPLSPVTVDNTGPADVTTVTTTGGIDTSGYLGFNAYADISWNSVTGGGIRGYRIRFSNDNGTTYSYVDSPGTGTTYRLGGLAIGSTYKIAVATYDEYNNLSSSYVAGPDVTVTGTPSVTNYITGGPFQFGVGVGSVSTNKGLYFDSSNYWYVNASNSARLKVGGSTSNYLLWDGATFAIDGNITARQGTFSGNVSIASGGSLYSGTLSGNSLSGAGYILNSSGLTFNSSSVNNITTIDGTTGLLTTSSANIGGWLVNPSTNAGTLYKTTGTNTVKLDSAGYITVSGTGYQTGIGYPASSGADANIVMWAGADKATAPFRVYKDGSVVLSSATITGYASDSSLSNYATTTSLTNGLAGKISTSGAAADVNLYTTTINGGKIRTGSIQSTTWSGSVTNGSDYSTSGMNINLDNAGSITAKNFRIDENGNAFFKGTLSSGIAIDAPVITGGAIDIGNGTFKVTTAGALTATSATITGNIVGGTFTLSGSPSTNYWTTSGFNLGAGVDTNGTAALINYDNSTSTITLVAGDTTSGSDTNSNADGTGSAVGTVTGVKARIILKSTSGGLQLRGIPTLGDYTRYNYPYNYYTNVDANSANTSYGMGSAARLRTLIQDPYDHTVYRGFAVYYGQRSNAPSGSTGVVGDLWVSW